MAYKSQTLSVVLITHNNADTLERALSSVKWADELIILDRGSTDDTLTIARAFTDKVHYHPGKNLTLLQKDALSLAKSDWILWIRPDEWVEEMLRHEIDGLLLNTPSHLNGYTIPRRLKFLNHWFLGNLGEESKRGLRLVRKSQWEIKHDWIPKLRANGDVGHLDRPLGYAPYTTLEDVFAAMNTQSTLAAYDYLDENGSRDPRCGGWRVLWRSKMAFYQRFLFQQDLKMGYLGFTISFAQAVHVFLAGCKVRELTRQPGTHAS